MVNNHYQIDTLYREAGSYFFLQRLLKLKKDVSLLRNTIFLSRQDWLYTYNFIGTSYKVS